MVYINLASDQKCSCNVVLQKSTATVVAVLNIRHLSNVSCLCQSLSWRWRVATVRRELKSPRCAQPEGIGFVCVLNLQSFVFSAQVNMGINIVVILTRLCE